MQRRDRRNVPEEISVAFSPGFRRVFLHQRLLAESPLAWIFPRPKGTLSFMLSHLTLRTQASTKQCAIWSLSLPSASGQHNISGIISLLLAFIPSLRRDFLIAVLNLHIIRELWSGFRWSMRIRLQQLCR